MRPFELEAADISDSDSRTRALILDLDGIVMFKEHLDAIGLPHWYVSLSSGDHVSLTRPAYEKLMTAWKSR